MVHAPKLLHGLLKPDGRLIDIRPSGEPPQIELVLASAAKQSPAAFQRCIPLGRLGETDGFVEYFRAAAAVASAIQDGWYQLEQRGVFRFITQAESVAELRRYLAENWQDAILAEDIECWADELTDRLAPQAARPTIRLIERVRILRLRPLLNAA